MDSVYHGPALYAGGTFLSAGGQTARRIARWNGVSWSGVGSGMEGNAFNDVEALAVFDDGTGAALYAGGQFSIAGGNPARSLARWDGSAWSEVGGGLDRKPFVLATGDGGDGEELLVAGLFQNAGNVAAQGIARWNGSRWAALGSGLPVVSVADMTVFDDGTGVAWFVGGTFGGSPPVDPALAKWGCPLPAGVSTFGSSSAGCTGPLAIGVSSAPRVGNTAFGITCTEPPPSAPGFLFVGGPLVPPTPLLGIEVWVNPVLALPVTSAAGGGVVTEIAVPIANDPALVGVQFDSQFVWIGPGSPAPCPITGLSGSNALSLTIQP